MKNSKKILIITLIITLLMVLASCNPSFVGLDSDRLSSDSANTTPPTNNVIAPTANYNVSIDTVTPTLVEGGLPEVVESVRDSVVSLNVELGEQGQSSGSGVFFAKDTEENATFIITCCHVIDMASKITAILTDGSEIDCLLIGGDDEKDIAVLKVDGNYQTAKIRNLDETLGAPLKLAESVFAIGNPLGTLGGSVTQGIISGVERVINMEGVEMSLLQIDVAVNPGNSGGALFDYYGNLVGIVNAKSVGADVEGIGYAIRIDEAISDAQSFLNTAGNPDFDNLGYIEGKVRLGVTVQGYLEDAKYVYLIKSLNIYGSVAYHNSTAQQENKVEINDIITGVKQNDTTIEFIDINTLGNLIKSLKVGDSITLLIEHPVSSGFLTYQYQSREISITMQQYVYGK